ncbi:unnamed protein product [Phaeothamnion confervicola]
MVFQVVLSPEHGYAAAILIVSTFVPLWAGLGVSKARKLYGIKYPQMYAEESHKDAKAFNCYQRAHQNVLENYPAFLVMMTLATLDRPLPAAVAGAVRLAGFVMYVKGYQTGSPSKRHQGAFGYLG